MQHKEPAYKPVAGKTYSLFSGSSDTSEYFEFIRSAVDELTNDGESLDVILDQLRASVDRQNILHRIFKGPLAYPLALASYKNKKAAFLRYTGDVGQHINNLSVFTGRSSALRTTELQYHMYMLEIEVVNRLNKEKFKACEYKLALLPHCLKDVWDECKSEVEDLDYTCKHCNKDCYLNHISRILKDHNVEPYIWTTRNLKKLLKTVIAKHPSFGVFGIACIPELIMGLRKSTKASIPAIGIPLNANCCIRWFGECKETSVDLGEIRKLLS
jgi:hypothetical protein